MHWLGRFVAYLWPVAYTLTGVALGLLLGARFQVVDGVIEIHGPRIAAVLNRLYLPAQAVTWGHVVFGQSLISLELTRVHERVHVRQYERWGPLFVPAYLGASAYLWMRGRDPYRENPFEVQAYALDGSGRA